MEFLLENVPHNGSVDQMKLLSQHSQRVNSTLVSRVPTTIASGHSGNWSTKPEMEAIPHLAVFQSSKKLNDQK